MVEVLIVLAVTGALFISAVALITGRQGQTEFDTSIHEIQSEIQQTVTEVSNGFYPNLGNFTCTASISGPTISGGSTGQGSNTGCIFLGKAIQFGMPSTDPEQFDTYSIAALHHRQPQHPKRHPGAPAAGGPDHAGHVLRRGPHQNWCSGFCK